LEEKSIGDRFESRCEIGDQYLYAIEPSTQNSPDEHFRTKEEKNNIFRERIFRKTKSEHFHIGYWDVGGVCCQTPFDTFIDIVVCSDQSTLKQLLYLYGYIDDSTELNKRFPSFVDIKAFRENKTEITKMVYLINRSCGYKMFVK